MPTQLTDGEGCTDGQIIDARLHPIRRGMGMARPEDATGETVLDEASDLYAVFQGGGPSGSRTGS